MLKNILLLAIIFSWLFVIQEIPYETVYDALVEFASDRRTLALNAVLLGGGLILVSYLFSCCGLYKVAKALSVLVETASLFLLFAFGCGHAFFYLVLEGNLYAATGYLPPFLLFLLLLSAIKAQRIVDFNHPLRQPLIPAVLFMIWPVVFVIFYSLFGR
ncbi:hypothetical protein ACHHRT_10825 [Desulfurivibrio sp. D14AmB]|uniref:hypothetical protein n=1 Tax=Desulfurivibrio sp. D14AmB TaxID=3374370 RepID=UPI00376F167C